MKYRWDKKYKYWGVTAFLVIAASVTYTLLLFNLDKVGGAISAVFDAVSGVTVGIVIAYLLAPVVNFLERKWLKDLPDKINKKDPAKGKRTVRGFAVTLALLFGGLIVTILCLLVLPKLIESLTLLADNITAYAKDMRNWLGELFAANPDIQAEIMASVDQLATGMQDWFKNDLLPNMTSVVETVSNGVIAVVTAITSVFVGVVVSIYLLFNKETFIAQMKRLAYAFLPVKWSDGVMRACSYTHKKIAGFISGQLLDSMIVGVITFIAMLIMGLGVPYSSLIAVVIGVTNVIPFFGPFIGAIPCAFIILLLDPIKAVIFVIFILVMQQIDGNIINPRIHGSNTGMSGFWVIFAISLGGGLFGFAGMVLSVPVFASIYTGITVLNSRLLRKKGLPTQTKDYRIEGALRDQPPVAEAETETEAEAKNEAPVCETGSESANDGD